MGEEWNLGTLLAIYTGGHSARGEHYLIWSWQ